MLLEVCGYLVHGGDFATPGLPEYPRWIDGVFRRKLQVETHVLGGEDGQVREAIMLNRLLSWIFCKGTVYEADPCHVERVVLDITINLQKTLKVPFARRHDDKGGSIDDEEDVNLEFEGLNARKKAGWSTSKLAATQSKVQGDLSSPGITTHHRAIIARAKVDQP